MVDLKQVMAGESPSQNLINQAKFAPIITGPGFYKSIALDVLSVLSAGFFGFSYYRYLENMMTVWWLLGARALWGTMSAFQVFLALTSARRTIILILESLAVLAFFYRADPTILFTTAVVVFVFTAWGYLASRNDLMNSVEIQFFRITSNVLGKVVTASLLFMIMAYVPQIGQGSLFVSLQNFRQFFDWSAGFINNLYPSVSLNGSFQAFAQGVAALELKNNPNFQAMSPQAQSSTISQAAAGIETSLMNASSDLTVAPTAPVRDAFYNFILGMLQGWKSQGASWFIIGWGVVLFFALRTLGIVFVWANQFLALILYEILLATGFMKITEATQTKEMIGY